MASFLGPDWSPNGPTKSPPPPSTTTIPGDTGDAEARAIAYLAKLPPAIQGSGGSSQTFTAARAVCYGFNLGEERGYQVLAAHYNPRCEPPWSEADLRKKCQDAWTKPFDKDRGYLLSQPNPNARRRESKRQLASRAPAPAHPGQPAAPETGTGTGPIVVRNFRVIPIEGGGVARPGITFQQIAGDVLRLTGGWPKRVGERLFVANPDYTPRWIDSAVALFGWLSARSGDTGGVVEWGRQQDHLSKSEFFEQFRQQVESFDDLQTFPHYPARPGTYYLHPPLPEDGIGAFDELLAHFLPATDADRYLIRAFFLTLVWGGSEGSRPVFVFEAAAEGQPGQGSGKSTVAMAAGELLGGFISIDLATAEKTEIPTRLLSDQGRVCRLAVFDNLKGTRTSNSLVESYITATKISGKQLYQGEGKRSNILTWAITSNQPAFSRDFAQRVYPIRLDRPTYLPRWRTALDTLIATRRWEIIADMAAELTADPQWAATEYSRWADWEAEVLCRVCDPGSVTPTGEAALRSVINERRAAFDDDEATASAVREVIANRVQARKGSLFEKMKVRLPSDVLVDALKDVSPYGRNLIGTLRWLSSLGLPFVQRRRSNAEKFWIWVGSEASEKAAIEDWESSLV